MKANGDNSSLGPLAKMAILMKRKLFLTGLRLVSVTSTF